MVTNCSSYMGFEYFFFFKFLSICLCYHESFLSGLLQSDFHLATRTFLLKQTPFCYIFFSLWNSQGESWPSGSLCHPVSLGTSFSCPHEVSLFLDLCTCAVSVFLWDSSWVPCSRRLSSAPALGEESLLCSCDARMAFVMGLFLVLLNLLAFCSCYCEDQTGFFHLSTAPQTYGSHVNVCWLSYWKLGGDLKQGDFPGPATGQVKRAEGATLGSSVASGTKNQTCLQPQVADCSACSPHNQRRKGHEINL